MSLGDLPVLDVQSGDPPEGQRGGHRVADGEDVLNVLEGRRTWMEVQNFSSTSMKPRLSNLRAEPLRKSVEGLTPEGSFSPGREPMPATRTSTSKRCPLSSFTAVTELPFTSSSETLVPRAK